MPLSLFYYTLFFLFGYKIMDFHVASEFILQLVNCSLHTIFSISITLL